MIRSLASRPPVSGEQSGCPKALNRRSAASGSPLPPPRSSLPPQTLDRNRQRQKEWRYPALSLGHSARFFRSPVGFARRSPAARLLAAASSRRYLRQMDSRPRQRANGPPERARDLEVAICCKTLRVVV